MSIDVCEIFLVFVNPELFSAMSTARKAGSWSRGVGAPLRAGLSALAGGSAARRRVYTVYRVPLDLVFELRRVADCDTLHPRRTPIARDEKTRSGPQKIHSPNHRASQAQTLISNLVHVWETHTHTYGAHGNMSVSPGQSYAMMRITSSSEPRRSSGRPRHQGCGHSPVRIAPRRQRESLQ